MSENQKPPKPQKPPRKKHRRPIVNKGKLRISLPGQLDDWEPDPKHLEIWARIEKGERHQSIADDFGISRGRVSQLSKQMRRWRIRQDVPKIDFYREQQIGRAEWAAAEAKRSWERSVKAGADNLQCLTVYLKAQEQINKILGINAEEESGGTTVNVNFGLAIAPLRQELLGDVRHLDNCGDNQGDSDSSEVCGDREQRQMANGKTPAAAQSSNNGHHNGHERH